MSWMTNQLLQRVGPQMNRKLTLETMPWDLGVSPEFESLVGIFASTSLNHGVVAMTIRQCAYMYGIVKALHGPRVLEIGRYKGGSTLVLSAACAQNGGQVWSVDNGSKVERLYGKELQVKTPWPNVTYIDGDSKMVPFPDDLDVVVVDGDHSYGGVKVDLDRSRCHLRSGGHLFVDDTYDEEFFPSHADTVGRAVKELQGFHHKRRVDRLAHLVKL